jgi:hypothetical protein
MDPKTKRLVIELRRLLIMLLRFIETDTLAGEVNESVITRKDRDLLKSARRDKGL